MHGSREGLSKNDVMWSDLGKLQGHVIMRHGFVPTRAGAPGSVDCFLRYAVKVLLSALSNLCSPDPLHALIFDV